MSHNIFLTKQKTPPYGKRGFLFSNTLSTNLTKRLSSFGKGFFGLIWMPSNRRVFLFLKMIYKPLNGAASLICSNVCFSVFVFGCGVGSLCRVSW